MKFLRAMFRPLLTPEGRRGWALALLAGGGIAMTIYAGAALILVRTNAAFVLYLGLAAHVSILIVLTGFAGLLVKRTISARIAGGEFSAADQADPATQAAAATAGAAVDKAAEIAGDAAP
ncbi:MAG: hypothetical protein V4527_18355 [Pseudomonadota bacterium]